MTAFDVACAGGWAHGAWFSDHQLGATPPQTIRVVTGSDVALLDLPADEPEPGETLHVYRLSSVGIVCTRGKGRCCRRVAMYHPDRPDGEDQALRSHAASLDA